MKNVFVVDGFSLTQEQKEWIEKTAHKRAVNKSIVVREAIELLRKKEKGNEENS